MSHHAHWPILAAAVPVRLCVPALIATAKRRFQSRSKLHEYMQSKINEATDEDSLISQLLAENRLRYLPAHGLHCSELDVAISMAFEYKKQRDDAKRAILLCKDACNQTESVDSMLEYERALTQSKQESSELLKRNHMLMRTVKRQQQEIESLSSEYTSIFMQQEDECSQQDCMEVDLDMPHDEPSTPMDSLPIQSSKGNGTGTSTSVEEHSATAAAAADPVSDRYIFVLSPDDDGHDIGNEEEERSDILGSASPVWHQLPNSKPSTQFPSTISQPSMDVASAEPDADAAENSTMGNECNDASEQLSTKSHCETESKSPSHNCSDTVPSMPSSSIVTSPQSVSLSRSSPFTIAVQTTVAPGASEMGSDGINTQNYMKPHNDSSASTFVEYLQQRGLSINDAWKTRTASQLYLEWDSLRKKSL